MEQESLTDKSERVGETFSNLDCSAQEITGVEFDSCDFRSCIFAKASLRKCRVLDCAFESCDFSLIKVANTRLRDVRFKDCKMIGINWAPTAGALDLAFEHCQLDYSIFAGLDLRRIKLIRCSARETDFSDSSLKEAVFTGTDFQGARFVNTDLTKADLRGATNYQIDPIANRLHRARFSMPEAVSLLRGLDISIEEPPV
jgi:uncharacterized protein YjbI with pentapeptide repeats